MIILYELLDFTEVIRIKMFAKVPFDRFGKKLRFVFVSVSAFVLATLSSWPSVG